MNDIASSVFRMWITFNSTSLILVLYAIKSHITINKFCNIDVYVHSFFSYFLYILIVVLSTLLSLFVAKKFLLKDCIRNGIVEIELASNSYLPSYMGYFFVALSINDCQTLIFTYLIVYVFTFYSQALYFNPIFLVFGYSFYYVKTSDCVKVFVITRQRLRSPKDVSLGDLCRINGFTFIDKSI